METNISSESLQKVYRRYSRYYDWIFGVAFHPGRKAAVEHLKCKRGDRILEVGVGTGLSLSMYPPGVKVVGIDLSEDMLMRARKKCEVENLTQVEDLTVMDAQSMNFPDNSFDKVVGMYVASVVPDMKKFMHEIRRVCQPGGTIVILNHFESERPFLQKVEGLIQPLAQYLGFNPDFPMQKFLKQTGFRAKEIIPVNMFDYWTILVGVNDKIPRSRIPKTKIAKNKASMSRAKLHSRLQ